MIRKGSEMLIRKNRSLKKVVLIIFMLAGILSACTAKPANLPDSPGVKEAVVTGIIDKYGIAVTDLTGADMLSAGYEYGDILAVKAGEAEFEVPFVTNFSDVDIGRGCLADMGVVLLAANMADFVSAHDIRQGMTVSFTMAEKAGYLETYQLRQVTRSYDREDYASDEIFANFREVRPGNIAPGVLYRSSSPADNMLGRAAYANALAEQAGIATVLNLTDSREALIAHFSSSDFLPAFYEGLFDNGRVLYLDMGNDIESDEFRYSLRDGFMLLAEYDGPYLIHCTEGKDRAGFMIMLIEALMGSDLDEIVADYMLSYVNYYHVEPGSERYASIAEGNILKTLQIIAGLDLEADLADVDLQAAAQEYIAALGVSPEHILAIKSNLSFER